MTNRDLYKVKQGITKCNNIVNIADINFAMSLARIDNEIENELRVIEKGKRKPSDKYTEYLKKKQELDLKYVLKKEDGTVQMLGNSFLLSNPVEYNVKLNVLEEEYKEELDTIKKVNTEFEEFLDQDCKTTISTLPKNCIPTQLTVEQMSLLFPIIK